ncbi:Molybdopterin-dependent oxidoreductase [Sulfidibacter corallicola]|uniref:Molybdopterin-dependent oxidoreductase n=1 Tax=Sulfidibacter corallicola TaxID=2818388 RepID=A0A8A4TLY3_SULCO|nr:molybdopterin-dependent oxidoreductase [Sulfidibacter corallicola]QTD49891.1 molybdopterin-dependent oxidoreductase [Sulfidibacter corallicola]
MSPSPILGVVGDDGTSHTPNPLAHKDDWRLQVLGLPDERQFSLQELAELGHVQMTLPIVCVSAGYITGARDKTVRFGGLPFPQLAARLGDLSPFRTVIFRSRARATCGPRNKKHETALELSYCLESGHVMLAWELNGAPLPYANGWPLRSTVGPDLFFYKSMKWLECIEFSPLPLAQCRGTWETYAGYHHRGRTEPDERFEPIMRRITGIDTEGSDVSEEIPSSAWQETLNDLVARKDLSRLIIAKMERMGLDRPKDYSGFCFSEGPYRAKIRGSAFQRSLFHGANLRETNLSLSKFPLCDFSDGGKNPADMTGVDAEGTDFSGADLRAVRMCDAFLAGAVFYNRKHVAAGTKPSKPAKVEGLDLRGAKNLHPLQAQWLKEDGALV